MFKKFLNGLAIVVIICLAVKWIYENFIPQKPAAGCHFYYVDVWDRRGNAELCYNQFGTTWCGDEKSVMKVTEFQEVCPDRDLPQEETEKDEVSKGTESTQDASKFYWDKGIYAE